MGVWEEDVGGEINKREGVALRSKGGVHNRVVHLR